MIPYVCGVINQLRHWITDGSEWADRAIESIDGQEGVGCGEGNEVGCGGAVEVSDDFHRLKHEEGILSHVRLF